MYENRIVAFIDILGFSNIVENTVIDPNIENEKVLALRNALIGINENANWLNTNADSRRITQFSDSIIISFLDNDDLAFRNFLENVSRVIIKLFLKNKFLVRGGVCKGKLLHEDKVIFGPAFNESYRLENKVAIYPRIIIKSEDIEQLVENDELSLTYLAEEDNYYYFDYLVSPSFLYYHSDECDNEFYALKYYSFYLPYLRSFIVEQINANHPHNLLCKYLWLRDKFNALLTTLHANPLYLGANSYSLTEDQINDVLSGLELIEFNR
jgi:hypothetical protein